MPVPTSLATLSQTPASNSPAGSDAVFPQLDDYMREMFADLARLRDGANTWLTAVAGTNTITATCSSINALVAGQVFRFVAAANTGAVTLNINGLGAKAVTRPGAVALVAGDMPTFAEVGYNGSTFELLNSKHVALADAATTATTATTAAGVPWSGVTGTPTTVAGYGITDASAAASDLKHSYQLADHGRWLLSDGRTIGGAASGATARANADTSNLYAALWAAISNADLPIQTSGGVPTTRGASAAADFSANKRLPLPNYNGLTIKGHHNGDGTFTTDTSRALGSYEADSVLAHTHNPLMQYHSSTGAGSAVVNAPGVSGPAVFGTTTSTGGPENLVRSRSANIFVSL